MVSKLLIKAGNELVSKHIRETCSNRFCFIWYDRHQPNLESQLSMRLSVMVDASFTIFSLIKPSSWKNETRTRMKSCWESGRDRESLAKSNGSMRSVKTCTASTQNKISCKHQMWTHSLLGRTRPSGLNGVLETCHGRRTIMLSKLITKSSKSYLRL